MADIGIGVPYGSIEVEIHLATTRDGNKALAEAAASAKAQAKAQGRDLGDGYGTRREGDTLAIIFPLRAPG